MSTSYGYWLERQRARLKEAVSWDDWQGARKAARLILDRFPNDSYATIILEQSRDSGASQGAAVSKLWHQQPWVKFGIATAVIVPIAIVALVVSSSGKNENSSASVSNTSSETTNSDLQGDRPVPEEISILDDDRQYLSNIYGYQFTIPDQWELTEVSAETIEVFNDGLSAAITIQVDPDLSKFPSGETWSNFYYFTGLLFVDIESYELIDQQAFTHIDGSHEWQYTERYQRDDESFMSRGVERFIYRDGAGIRIYAEAPEHSYEAASPAMDEFLDSFTNPTAQGPGTPEQAVRNCIEIDSEYTGQVTNTSLDISVAADFFFVQSECDIIGTFIIDEPTLIGSGTLFGTLSGTNLEFTVLGSTNDSGVDLDFSGIISSDEIAGTYEVAEWEQQGIWDAAQMSSIVFAPTPTPIPPLTLIPVPTPTAALPSPTPVPTPVPSSTPTPVSLPPSPAIPFTPTQTPVPAPTTAPPTPTLAPPTPFPSVINLQGPARSSTRELYGPQTVIWTEGDQVSQHLATVESDFAFETILISPQGGLSGQWSWGFHIVNDDTTALDVLLLSGGTSVVSIDQGSGITSAVNTANQIVDSQNHRNEIKISSKNNLVTLEVNGVVVQTVDIGGSLIGEASIYRDVLGHVTLPGFAMTSESASLVHTEIAQDATINLGPIVGSEIISRIDTEYFDSLDVTFHYPLKHSDQIVDMGLRIGFEDIEMVLVGTIEKFTGDIFFVQSEAVYPSVQSSEEHAERRTIYDHDGDHFKVSLENHPDYFMFTVDGERVTLSRFPRWGEVSYIEFFTNSDKNIIDDNTAYFSKNPYVDLTGLSIWSR